MNRKQQQMMIDYDEILDEEADAEAAADSLDALFNEYYTPEVAEDADADIDEHFLPAITADTEAMLADFEIADEKQRKAAAPSLLGKVKNIVQSGVDYNYFFCVVFVSETQKIEFLEKAGWMEFGGARYLNGVEMAKAMGIELASDYVAPEVKPDRVLAERSKKQRKEE